MTTYQKGMLYQFDGNEFVPLEPSEEKKLPLTNAAIEAVKATRKEAAKAIGMRPELSLVASAMILAASTLPEMPQLVKEYGQQVYR